MGPQEMNSSDFKIVVEVNRNQLEHFTQNDARCRGVQLPEGVMLRYTLSHSLYFYLRTLIKEGMITTRVFASDTPYDRQKSGIGEVITPMFEPNADETHLKKLDQMLQSWVDFVKDDIDSDVDFKSFQVGPQHGGTGMRQYPPY